MRQRYIDFVPAKNKSATGGAKAPARRIAVGVGSNGSRGVKAAAGGASAAERAARGAQGPSGAKSGGVSANVAKKSEEVAKKPVSSRKFTRGIPSVEPAGASAIKASRAAKSAEIAESIESVESMEDEMPIEEMFAERVQPAGVSKGGSKLGVIEDYKPKFVKAEVAKRPLGSSGAKGAKNTVAKAVGFEVAKTSSTAAKTSSTVAKKPVKKLSTAKATGAKAAGATGAAKVSGAAKAAGASGVSGVKPLPRRANFVNTNKIEKRPLSKNVYQKKVVTPIEEKPSKPVKIIEKPEKDSKAGMIIAIILTIILGAAAGTVAFLILPK